MKKNNLDISIIVPTHNRNESLKRLLKALSNQTFPLERVEVLVVADGCSDDTVKTLHQYQAPFILRIVEQPGLGAAAARNKGAELATSSLLLFLDDDVEPTSHLIEAHVQAHIHPGKRVVIGLYPPAPRNETGYFEILLRGWWEAVFEELSRPGHRFTYQDLLSGNLSLATDLFKSIGGFDTNPAFKAHEDYELGIRLIKANVTFSTAVRAVAYHHDESSFERACQRKRHEGRADVFLARRYPELFQTLPLSQIKTPNLLLHILRSTALRSSQARGIFNRPIRYAISVLEHLKLHKVWNYLNGAFFDYWYWRGVADVLGSRQRLADLAIECQAQIDDLHPSVDLDLLEGVAAVEQRLDEERPMAARLRYGRHHLGIIPAYAGAEALRGAHLRPMLAGPFAAPFLEALAIEGVISVPETVDNFQLAKAISRQSSWFGLHEPGYMWFEQYGQWQRLKDGVGKTVLASKSFEP